ncbi:hypothetical protein OF001_U10016 [Pseudomonas sp. OF001]|nr:hypothetical protein OF001_U10016 [Pseudomonas sp. OF001]
MVVRRKVTARRHGADTSMSAAAGSPSPWLVAYGFTLRPVRPAATGGLAFFIPTGLPRGAILQCAAGCAPSTH